MSLILDGTLGLSDVDGTAATPAIRGTDSNTGVFFATDIVGLATGGSERMRIDSSGNVGIGTSSPAVKTEIYGTAAASNLALRITNIATDGYSTLQMGDGNAGVYRNGSAQSGYAGASSLNLITVGSHAIGFSTGNTLRAIIPAAGGVQAVTCVSVGNATPANSGAGITFPATQSASSDANTLDDYEEGTWTPNVGGNATYTIQQGIYVKVGKLVTVNFDMAINTIGTGSQTSIAGFPFTSSNEGFPRTGCISYYEALSVSPVWVAFYVQNNATTCLFVWNTVGAATVGNNGANLFTNTSRIIGSVSYTASA